MKCYTPDVFITQRLRDDSNLNVEHGETRVVSDRNINGMCY
mgnify:CR=1 FL=1